MNKGLKSYAKQLKGQVGKIKYNINLNFNDSNVILEIPLFNTLGINPLSLSLIYNHQSRTTINEFGAGIKTNYDYKYIKSLKKIINPDFTEDIYTGYQQADQILYPNKYIYRNKDTNFDLYTSVRSDVNTNNFLYDPYKNKYNFDNNTNNYITKIEYINGFVTDYKANNILLNNNQGTIITKEELVSGSTKKIILYELENNIEISRVTLYYNNSTNKLYNITFKEDYIDEYYLTINNNNIKIYSERDKYAILINLIEIDDNNKKIEIYEEYYDYFLQDDDSYDVELDGQYLLYTINLNLNKTEIIDKNNNKSYIKFDDRDLPILEYTDKNVYIKTSYDNDKKLIYQGNSVNLHETVVLGDNSFTHVEAINVNYQNTTISNDIYTLGFNHNISVSYNDNQISKMGFIKEANGLKDDIITIITILKLIAKTENSSAKINIYLYKDNIDVIKKEFDILNNQIINEKELVIVGFKAPSPYDEIKVEIESYLINYEISDIILTDMLYGTYYSYSSDKRNIIKIDNGINDILLGYSNNIIESELSTSGSETIYKYDSKNNPIIKMNSYGNYIKYNYDENTNQILSINPSYSSNTIYEYDSVNNVTKIKEYKNINEYDETNNTYDKYHRIITTSKNNHNFNYTYQNGRIATISENGKNININYDDKGLIKEIITNNLTFYFIYTRKNILSYLSINNRMLFDRFYDDNDNLIKIKYSNENITDFIYNNNLLTDIKYNNSNRFNIEYDNYSRITKINNELLNIATNYYYDNYNRIKEIIDNNNQIKYFYNEENNYINKNINIRNYNINYSYNNYTNRKLSLFSRLRYLFNNRGYVGTFFLSDTYLRGKNNEEYLIYPSSLNLNNIRYIEGIPQYSLLLNPNFYISTNNTTSGSIGFWYQQPDFDEHLISSRRYILLSKENKDNNNIRIYLKIEGYKLKLCLKVNSNFYDYEMSERDYTSNWHFISMSYSINSNTLAASIQLDNYIKDQTFNLPYEISFTEECYHIGKIYSDGNTYLNLTGNITGIIESIDTRLDNNILLEYYNKTKDCFNTTTNNSSIDYQVSSISLGVEDYDLIPLEGSINSINGLKPTNYEHKEKIYDKPSFYDYNVNKYSYEAFGNSLIYELGNKEIITLGMIINFNKLNERQTILELINTSNITYDIELYVDSDNYIKILYDDVVINTNLLIVSLNNNHICFNLNKYTNKIEINLSINTNTYSKTINIPQISWNIRVILFDNFNNEYPLLGNIEKVLYSNTKNNLDTLYNYLFTITKTNEIDDLGYLYKSTIYEEQRSIISNNYEYTNQLITKEVIHINQDYNRYYSYSNNRVTTITDSTFGNKSYSYDSLGRLINDNGTIITYDNLGNITNYGNKSYSYNGYLLTSMNGENVSYYNNSYLIKKYEDMEFKYEGKRLVEIKKDNDEEITYYKYYYNLDGLRIKKEVITEYSDYRDPEVEVTQYYYEDNKLICEYRNDSLRIDYLYDINDNLFGFILNDNRYYYIRDCMQNILGIIDNNGNIIAKYNYNGFGRIISITGSNTAIGSLNPFRYKGYYYDNDTYMYYCKSRYYNPLWCRWLTPDSVDYLNPDYINGLNLYCYCMNDPVNLYDSSGHWVETVFDLFSLGVSIVEVIINPYDPLNWAGLAGDALDLIPFVTGVGETVRGVKVVAKGVDMTDDVYDTIKIMKVADLTDDAWDTVRGLDRAGDFTQSTMSAGRRIHKGYKTFDLPGKEYGKIPGIRMDYFDKAGKLVYELKPYNVKSLKAGVSQLSRYRRTMGKGYTWILELY